MTQPQVGGMGDVVTALGRAVQEEGHDVEVLVPKYDVINYNQVEDLVQDGSFFWENSQVKIWKGKVRGWPGSCGGLGGCGQQHTVGRSPTAIHPHPPPKTKQVEGLPTTFLEPENGHFWRGCIYGRNDDHVRFGYFCGAALEYLKVGGGAAF
jgi:starch synthase